MSFQKAIEDLLKDIAPLEKAEDEGDEGAPPSDEGGDAHAEPDGDEPPMDAGGPDMGAGGPPAGGPDAGADPMAEFRQALQALSPDQLQQLKMEIDQHMAKQGGAGGPSMGGGAPPALGKGQLPYNKANGDAVMKKAEKIEQENRVLKAQIKLLQNPPLAKALTEFGLQQTPQGTKAVSHQEAGKILSDKYASLAKSEQALVDSFVFSSDPNKKAELFKSLQHLL